MYDYDDYLANMYIYNQDDYIGYDDNKVYVRHCCLADGVYDLTCWDHSVMTPGSSWEGGYLTIEGKTFCGGDAVGSFDWIFDAADYVEKIETQVTIGGRKLTLTGLFEFEWTI